jgi:GTP-dependent phosphoenolpyruvate carboxykinase
MRTIEKGNSIFTNVALTDDGDVWWEGMTKEKPAHLTDWKGRDWTPDNGELSAHPNSRFTTPAKQCPMIAPEYDNPNGVPISAILFGGRRATTVPLVYESRDWTHGTFVGATLSSETTAAATGAVGVVRRDPMAMLPFIGYNAGRLHEPLARHRQAGRRVQAAEDLPGQLVPQGRRGRHWLPVAGLRRQQPRAQVGRRAPRGRGRGVETPVGSSRRRARSTPTGLDMTAEDVAKALAVDVDEWRAELPLIEEWFAKIGDRPIPALKRADAHRYGIETANEFWGPREGSSPCLRLEVPLLVRRPEDGAGDERVSDGGGAPAEDDVEQTVRDDDGRDDVYGLGHGDDEPDPPGDDLGPDDGDGDEHHADEVADDEGQRAREHRGVIHE